MSQPVGGRDPLGGMLGPQEQQSQPKHFSSDNAANDGIIRWFKEHGASQKQIDQFRKSLEKFLAARSQAEMKKMDAAIKKMGQKIKSGE